MIELWKEVDGYNGRYEVSSYGRIKSYAQDKISGKIKVGNPTKKGYLTFLFYDEKGHKKWIPVHRIVAMAFIDNPKNLPQINHKDEDKTNNHIDNLEWCTNEYNNHYGTRIQRASKANLCCASTSKKVYSVDPNGQIECFDSIGEAERITGNSHCNIVRALKGRRKTCGNRKWFYA